MTCSNEMGRLSKKIKIELVTPLERICINLSNGVKITGISHTQPKLLGRVESFKRRKTHLNIEVK